MASLGFIKEPTWREWSRAKMVVATCELLDWPFNCVCLLWKQAKNGWASWLYNCPLVHWLAGHLADCLIQ